MADPRPREVIDYALARRAALAELFAGKTSTSDVCDAHPYLIRAARYHGEPSQTRCPVCKHAETLLHVYYAYGEVLGYADGRPRRARDLAALDALPGKVRIYLVEVCSHCGWNHLVSSGVLGGCTPSPPRRRPTDAAAATGDAAPAGTPAPRRGARDGQAARR